MAPQTHFDFRRYGKYMIVVSLFLGLFLTRHFGGCLKHYWDAWDLSAGYVDAKGSSGLVDETGQVQKGVHGSYDEEVFKRASFPKYAKEVCRACAEHKSFSDPMWAYYGFWGLLCLGLGFVFIDRFIATGWRDAVRRRNDEQQDALLRADESDRAARLAQSGRGGRKVQPIDVGPFVSHGMANTSTTPPKRPPARTPTSNLPTLNPSRFSVENKPSAPGGPKPVQRPASAAKLPRIEPGARSLAKPDMAPIPDTLAPPTLPEFKIEGNAARDPTPVPSNNALLQGDWSLGPDPQDEKVQDDWLNHNTADEQQKARSYFDQNQSSDESLLDLEELIGSGDQVLGDPEDATRIVPVQANADDFPPNTGQPVDNEAPGEAFVLKGREADLHIYVSCHNEDPASDGMTPDSPLTTINEAVARARQISSQGRPVQIRVLPGKYHESIVLPPGVAMVNHMGPTGSSPDQRRSWLQGTTQRERNTHVTLTAPDGTCAVTIQNDSQGIIAGIHILGNRENNGPTRGLLIQDCARVKVYLCRIASHYIDADGAAIHLSPKTSTAPCRLLIQDSIIEQNRCTGRGAGIFLDRGLVVVRQSRINENEAGIAGGGLYATNTGDQPLLLEHTVMERNTVYVDGELPKASKEGWFGETGHGGCVFVVGGTLHLKNSDMIANTAHGAGGAIFATHSRVLIEGTEDVLEHLGRLVDNRSVRGGAILMRGGTQAQTTALKIVGAQLTANVAQHSGGAIAAANLVHIEISGTGLHHNKVTGDRAEGGAIHITLGTRARIDTSHLLSNQATFRAGAISACNSSLRLLSGCTLRQNQCTHGDSGAIAHYTMASSHLDLLRQNGHIEEPAVFAMEEVEVESNQAAKAVGGVFVGNYSKEASLPIVVAIRVPGCITQNKVCASDGGQEKPANLLVFWNRAVRANDKHPPDGPLQLK